MTKAKIQYTTFNDQPSGIYASQVLDVIKQLGSYTNSEIQLVAFFSIRKFGQNKRWVKERYPNSWVLPMFPKLKFWRLNVWYLRLINWISNPAVNICRGPFACGLALAAKSRNQKVCYDGRGAVDAEVQEYQVIDDPAVAKQVFEIERKVVLDADVRIAVTQKLAEYWQEKFGFDMNNYVVVPCTLNTIFEYRQLNMEAERSTRLGWGADDIILVYAGSTAGWQSLSYMEPVLKHLLIKDDRVKLLFMSGEDATISELEDTFPGRVQSKWVKHEEVVELMRLCDYGLLIREDSVTNQVASPTKFAEYLGAGLQVLISEKLGDYSDFVRQAGGGMVVDMTAFETLSLIPQTDANRKRSVQLCVDNFTKLASGPKDSYAKLANLLGIN